MPQIDWDLQQGSLAWYKARSGIPTSSEFHHIITPKQGKISESRKPYQCRLIAERLLRWQADSLDKIKHIEDGKTLEPFAAAQLEEIKEIETRRVGFIRTDDGRFGASPDRVVMSGEAIGMTVEIKSPTIPKQFEYLFFGNDEIYRCQVQGHLLVAEADKAILYTYNPHTPAFEVETGRDEVFLKKLRDALEQFSDELEEMTERARNMGAFQPFPELVTPLDAERGDPSHYVPPSDAEIQNLIDGPWGEFG